MDLVSVYNDYPGIVLVQLADLGFVPDGDLRALIHARIATRELPVNTPGGQLSAGQAGAAGGLHGMVEVVAGSAASRGPAGGGRSAGCCRRLRDGLLPLRGVLRRGRA